jgi:hypothetical protein
MARGTPVARLVSQSILVLVVSITSPAFLQGQDISTHALFMAAPFDQWQTEGPRLQVPWKVRLLPVRLSMHQRLEAAIEVQIPEAELAKRRGDGPLVLLVQLTDPAGRRYRHSGLFDLENIAGKATKKDIPFYWIAFVLPGEYEVAVALYDKVSGEHNFHRSRLQVDPLPGDPLPNAWRGLPSVEFWTPLSDRLDSLYRTEVEGGLSLPLRTRRPLHLEVLADLTPSEMFQGDGGAYERYLSGVVPMLKTFSQISVSYGSLTLAALNLEQRRVTAEEPNLSKLEWGPLKKTLVPEKGPGVVTVSRLMQPNHNPAYLRDELVRRIDAAPDAPSPAGDPLLVFVVIGGPMDSYSFPDLPPVALSRETPCVIFYVQYDYQGAVESRKSAGAAKNIEKMLHPLRVQTLTVRSAESVREALGKILERVGQM